MGSVRDWLAWHDAYDGPRRQGAFAAAARYYALVLRLPETP
jgi:hypothetical protein